MNVHMLNRHLLLTAVSALAVQRRQQFDEGAGRARRSLAKPLGSFERLIRKHSPPAALHRCVMRRHRLGGQHALDLIGRLERPQSCDSGEPQSAAIFV